MKARKIGRALAQAARAGAREVVGGIGAVAVVIGVAQIYTPAAWILGGAALVAAAIFTPRGA